MEVINCLNYIQKEIFVVIVETASLKIWNANYFLPHLGIDFDHISVIEFLHSLFYLGLANLVIHREHKYIVFSLYGCLSGQGKFDDGIKHLGAIPPESGDFQEMVCQACMERCSFLWAYAAQLAVTKVSAEDDGLLLNVDGMGDQEVVKPENGGHQDNTQKVDVPEHEMNAGKEVKAEQQSEPCASSSSESDRQTVFNSENTKTELKSACRLQELQAKQFVKKDAATYWPLNWRSKLCTCQDCMVLFLSAQTSVGGHPFCPHDHSALGHSFLKPALQSPHCFLRFARGLKGFVISLDQRSEHQA
ncbi:ubiquitin protein ligase E3 component n-recognin 7 (putative) [Cricetulus griseus]